MKRAYVFIIILFFAKILCAQNQISGSVKNTAGEPLIGANVVIENSFIGVITDANGKFKISGLKNGEYLVKISFIGYESKTEQINLSGFQIIDVVLTEIDIVTDDIVISAIRAGNKTPVTYTNVVKQDFENQNMGQDLPYILSLTPSLVTTSDAGTGVGYTGLRIRGTDASRINVTINGIPFNDAESHSVYWVDVPDFASSVDNIQIQRGVGTSTNGAGAFGATVNLQSNNFNKQAYSELSTYYGSFNTLKNSISFGSGLINKHFTVDARLSRVKSDGFIDRAFSDLKSYFVSSAYYNGKNMFRFNVFSGTEETYQAWNGVPKVRLENDFEGMKRYEEHGLYSAEQTQQMINSNNRTYNLYTYGNEIDHYEQSHYQLLYSRKIFDFLNFNTALHYTKGLGYYEQFKQQGKFKSYNLPPFVTPSSDTITKTDLIRRKWLDNDFYGITYSVNYNHKKIKITLGGAWNKYDGNHFGKIIWMQYAGTTPKDYEWYRGKGVKSDFNSYLKFDWNIVTSINLYADIQYRLINYKITGINDKLVDIAQKHNFSFVNPKFGAFFDLSQNQNLYVSYSVANREPSRSNFIDAPIETTPKSEKLQDYEFGYKFHNSLFMANVNFYYMLYDNQLVLTGKVNDTGDPIMVNVPESYRTGIEIVAGVKISKILKWDGNITLSKNKINNFELFVDDWDTWGQISENKGTTDISFSPEIIAGSNLNVNPFKNFSILINSKYVGDQFIDNSSNAELRLDAYFVNDLQFTYILKTKFINEIVFNFRVNNILDTEYESNAWIYRYYLDGKHYTMDGYFPQAGRNLMGGITLKF